MTAEQALRFAAYEAAECRDRDAHEALCLLFPPMLRVLALEPMTDREAQAFRRELKLLLASGQSGTFRATVRRDNRTPDADNFGAVKHPGLEDGRIPKD